MIIIYPCNLSGGEKKSDVHRAAESETGCPQGAEGVLWCARQILRGLRCHSSSHRLRQLTAEFFPETCPLLKGPAMTKDMTSLAQSTTNDWSMQGYKGLAPYLDSGQP